MDKQFHSTLYWECDYLSKLWLKLNHVSKWGPGLSIRILNVFLDINWGLNKIYVIWQMTLNILPYKNHYMVYFDPQFIVICS